MEVQLVLFKSILRPTVHDSGGGGDLRLMVSEKSREIATLLDPSRTSVLQ